MKSGHSGNTADAQSIEQDIELIESQMQKVENFLASIKDQEGAIIKDEKQWIRFDSSLSRTVYYCLKLFKTLL